MTTSPLPNIAIDLAQPGDEPALRAIAEDSAYAAARSDGGELAAAIAQGLAVVARSWRVEAFLTASLPSAGGGWLTGFGVVEAYGHQADRYLKRLLPALGHALARRDATTLHGLGDPLGGWLATLLVEAGFQQVGRLVAYERLLGGDGPRWDIPGITLRACRPEDIPAVAAVDAIAFEDPWRYDAGYLRDLLDRYPHFVVAESQGRVIAYQCSIVDRYAAQIVRLAVLPEYRGRGLGRRLLHEAFLFCAGQGLDRVYLNTQKENAASQQLYTRLGFRQCGPLVPVLRYEVRR